MHENCVFFLPVNILTVLRAGFLGRTSLACQTVCVGAANKPPGHCCTHSVTTARMLAEPIRSLRGHCDETNTNNSNS